MGSESQNWCTCFISGESQCNVVKCTLEKLQSGLNLMWSRVTAKVKYEAVALYHKQSELFGTIFEYGIYAWLWYRFKNPGKEISL